MGTVGLAGIGVLAAASVCLLSGCSTLGYYVHSAGGHLDLLRSARPVHEWMADAQAPAALKERLALSQRIRDYAVNELALPDNASYRRYADLQRGAAVWNVVAAPPFSLELKTWCFPIVGCVAYRGYFDRARAEALADELRGQGMEVSVYGVPAYSTLGALPGSFFADPVLSTFVNYPEGELARLIFHELAHQVAYARGDTEFNESFATAVERIGSRRWLSHHAAPQAREEYERYDRRRREFRALTLRYRDRLEALYQSEVDDERKRDAKAELMSQLRAEYEAMKRSRWGGFSGYDAFFARANNASLGVLAAYNQLVPDFEQLFVRNGSDFSRFYADVKRLAALRSRSERRLGLVAAQD